MSKSKAGRPTVKEPKLRIGLRAYPSKTEAIKLKGSTSQEVMDSGTDDYLSDRIPKLEKRAESLEQCLTDFVRVHYAPEEFSRTDVEESTKRILDNGGTLYYWANVKKEIEK